MSRNSIRLIKGQNRIELIYRVNSESLKMKEKKKKAYELDFFWHTNCLWTEEEPYSLSSGNLLPRWLGEEVPTETAPVVSMINIFLFAPVTTPPLNANYFSEVLSQIQSFYAKKGRLGAPPPVAVMHSERPKKLIEIHVFCSDFRHVSSLQEVAVRRVV